MENKTFIDDLGYSNFTITKGMTKGIAKKRANQQAIDYAVSQGTPRSMDLEQGESLTLGERTSGVSEDVLSQPEFSMNSAIAILAENEKSALVRMLQKQGSFVTPLSSKKTIFDATLKTIKDNADFRKKLGDYIIEQVKGEDMPKPQSQKEGSLIRIAQGSFPTLIGRSSRGAKGQAINSNFSSFSDFDDNFANQVKEKTKAGALLSSIFSKENIEKGVGMGMGYLATRMNANAQKGSNQQAIEFEKAQTEKALAQAKLEEAKASASSTSTTPTSTPDGKGKKKWVMPVAIGGGVLLLGTIIYFVMKKKN